MTYNRRSLWCSLFYCLAALSLEFSAFGNKVGGSTWEEAKEALRTVHYSYSYSINDEITEEVDETYDFVEPIMHELDDEWLSALVLGKGRKITIVFGGADEQDVKIFCNHFAGRHPSWGRGAVGGKVHGGFLKHFHGLWPEIFEAIIDYAHQIKRDPAKIDFDIIGHSMGAGLAQIAAMRLRTGLLYRTIPPRSLFIDLPQYTEENRPSKIKVITFGAMRVFDDVAAHEYRTRLDLEKNTLRIVHKEDWVMNKIPRVFGVTHVGACVELPDPVGYLDEITGKVAKNHMLTGYHVALNQLIESEEEFKEKPRSQDRSALGTLVGYIGFATTGPTELLLNRHRKHLLEAHQVNKERVTADKMAHKYLNLAP